MHRACCAWARFRTLDPNKRGALDKPAQATNLLGLCLVLVGSLGPGRAGTRCEPRATLLGERQGCPGGDRSGPWPPQDHASRHNKTGPRRQDTTRRLHVPRRAPWTSAEATKIPPDLQIS